MSPHPTLSRRAFLQTTALAALAPAGAFAAAPARRRAIDAHVHVWTPDTVRYPLADGFTKEKDMKPPSFTPAELFAHCRPEGVDRVVLVQMSFYQFDNRYMLDVIKEHPGTFSGIGIVDEAQSNVRETMKTLATQGVRGFRLYTSREKAEAWSQSEGMKKMWSYAAEAGAFQAAGIPTVLCGPGDIAQAHKPNEFIALDQVAAAEKFMADLLVELRS